MSAGMRGSVRRFPVGVRYCRDWRICVQPSRYLAMDRCPGKLVGDHDAGRPHLLLQQLPEQPLGSLLVASALDQDVEHDAGLVHGSPQPMPHPGNLKRDLIKMPFVADPRPATTDLVGGLLTELTRL